MKRKDNNKNLQFDEDRMINEGLAGGTVLHSEDNSQIEEARDIPKEEPPRRRK
ncbi:hypothetical protein [Salibacterium qingdaonense]|uniref:Uncharacterized protein n=1 Tax=Salibacterium qingdaonense TaxID=266892 RepID=A0A1I4JA74_9BACI|nr:hypothetical protein [Salibacterium qingdaonense]SFL63444.1 hypothetical protein SAMN04488054_10345 [Salibacterium qingdaonense]